MSSSRCSTFHSHRGSSIVSSWAIRASSMASPVSGKADPLAGQVAELEALISCVTPAIGPGSGRSPPGTVARESPSLAPRRTGGRNAPRSRQPLAGGPHFDGFQEQIVHLHLALHRIEPELL